MGNKTLATNATHKVVVSNLGSAFRGRTFATIDAEPVPVEYLTPQSNGALDMTKLNGDLFIGGYQDINDLRVMFHCTPDDY